MQYFYRNNRYVEYNKSEQDGVTNSLVVTVLALSILSSITDPMYLPYFFLLYYANIYYYYHSYVHYYLQLDPIHSSFIS
jgi:hypothetical protein